MYAHLMAASLRLPYPAYLRRVIRRSVGIWLLVRIAYVVVLMVGVMAFNLIPPAEGIALVLHPTWATRGVLVALAAVLVWWDRRRSHELLLPANLGAWPGWFWIADDPQGRLRLGQGRGDHGPARAERMREEHPAQDRGGTAAIGPWRRPLRRPRLPAPSPLRTRVAGALLPP